MPYESMDNTAKAIADKIDFGSILMDVTNDDLEALKPLIDNGFPVPNTKLSVYKNRGGKYKGMYLWMISDKGTCRYNYVFATSYRYESVDIKNMKIKVRPQAEESAF